MSERIFVSGTSGLELMSERGWEKHVGLSDDMALATDILFDANMLDAKRLNLLKAAEESGRNPADFARHLVRLSNALKH